MDQLTNLHSGLCHCQLVYLLTKMDYSFSYSRKILHSLDLVCSQEVALQVESHILTALLKQGKILANMLKQI